MNHIEFQPLHNFHTELTLIDGNVISGVALDPMNSHETGLPDTVYIFIPTKNMRDWKIADEEKNKERMEALQRKLDITEVVSGYRLQ